MKSMKLRHIISISVVLFVTILFADTIYLKNGLKIEGELLSVTADSVTIKTTNGQISIAAAEVDKIETTPAAPVAPSVPVVPEVKVVKEEGIPRSIKQVGYGCLGGVIGGAASGILAMWTDGYGGSGEATTTIVLGSIIVGILLGAAVGGGN